MTGTEAMWRHRRRRRRIRVAERRSRQVFVAKLAVEHLNLADVALACGKKQTAVKVEQFLAPAAFRLN